MINKSIILLMMMRRMRMMMMMMMIMMMMRRNEAGVGPLGLQKTRVVTTVQLNFFNTSFRSSITAPFSSEEWQRMSHELVMSRVT